MPRSRSADYEKDRRGRSRAVSVAEAVWCVCIPEISISDSWSNNTCEGFDWWVDFIIIISVICINRSGFFVCLALLGVRFAKWILFLADVACVLRMGGERRWVDSPCYTGCVDAISARPRRTAYVEKPDGGFPKVGAS